MRFAFASQNEVLEAWVSTFMPRIAKRFYSLEPPASSMDLREPLGTLPFLREPFISNRVGLSESD